MLYVGVLFFLILQYLRPQDWFEPIRGWTLVEWTMAALSPPCPFDGGGDGG